MPFIPAENTARVTVVMDLHDQIVTNTFYVRKDTAWDEPGLTNLANLAIAWWNDHLAPNLSQNIILTKVQVRDMSIADGLAVELAAPANSGGDVLNPAMPGNVALAVKFVTGFSGRNKQGRNFVAGLPENAQEGNEVTLNVRDLLLDAYEALRGDLEDADLELVVASFYDGTALVTHPDGTITREPVARPGGALLTPVRSFTAGVELDSQRRRLSGRGR